MPGREERWGSRSEGGEREIAAVEAHRVRREHRVERRRAVRESDRRGRSGGPVVHRAGQGYGLVVTDDGHSTKQTDVDAPRHGRTISRRSNDGAGTTAARSRRKRI